MKTPHERARETAEKILHIANYYHEQGSDMSDEHAASIILDALTAATADLRAEVAGLQSDKNLLDMMDRSNAENGLPPARQAIADRFAQAAP
jgi:aminoglycoside phosphotransferase family enzyme